LCSPSRVITNKEGRKSLGCFVLVAKQGVAEDQVCRTGRDFLRRNDREIIRSANFVLLIATLIDMSILAERIDSNA
jgi:hypothetical protein